MYTNLISRKGKNINSLIEAGKKIQLMSTGVQSKTEKLINTNNLSYSFFKVTSNHSQKLAGFFI